MNLLVIDAQGGGIGRRLVTALKRGLPEAQVTAVGTSSRATEAMMRAGADRAATGENAVIVGCRTADVIVGPVGIVIADAMLGEVTPAMAAAVGQSRATRVLIPISFCDNLVVGTSGRAIAQLVDEAVQAIKALDSAGGAR